MEWSGGGPGVMHVHHEDDEMWHVLSGRLRFRLGGDVAEVGPGTTVFVPAGVAHDYDEVEPGRYLLVMTPRLAALIDALHRSPPGGWDDVMWAHASEIVDG